jgi:hypothetical protein
MSGQGSASGSGGSLIIPGDGGAGPEVPPRDCPPVDGADTDCPAERPTFLCPCSAPRECSYQEDTCGTTQTVWARCDGSQWRLYGSPDETGPELCRFNHMPGTPCDLPPGCTEASCYSLSCYGEPYVEECVEGVWRTATLCSK